MPVNYDPDKHHRRSIRLKGYDYRLPGAYFVTVCTHDRKPLFGDVVDGKMCLNRLGRIVRESWAWLTSRYTYVASDLWVVMPNHLHGIIMISEGGVASRRGDSRIAPTSKRKPLGRLVGAFKTVSARRINEVRNTAGARVWQRNYYERIIRNDEELNAARQYIVDNPRRWAEDVENPAMRR